MLAKLFYMVLFIAGGILLIKYRRNIYDMTGGFSRAEVHLGRGSTETVLILLGLLFIFLGFIFPFSDMQVGVVGELPNNNLGN